LKFAKGASVKPGQVLAVLNNYNPPHVHFGINMGRDYPSSSTSKHYVGIMMGHTYDYKVVDGNKVPITYNWVDPIAFLNTNRPYSPPPASLTTPTVPTALRARRVFTVWGLLAPRHPRGVRSVTVQCDQYVSGAWVRRMTVRAIGWNSGIRTRWEAPMRLTRGRWRLRSHITADAQHGEAYSGWAEASVK
jgi:hypothetical protein